MQTNSEKNLFHLLMSVLLVLVVLAIIYLLYQIVRVMHSRSTQIRRQYYVDKTRRAKQRMRKHLAKIRSKSSASRLLPYMVARRKRSPMPRPPGPMNVTESLGTFYDEDGELTMPAPPPRGEFDDQFDDRFGTEQSLSRTRSNESLEARPLPSDYTYDQLDTDLSLHQPVRRQPSLQSFSQSNKRKRTSLKQHRPKTPLTEAANVPARYGTSQLQPRLKRSKPKTPKHSIGRDYEKSL